MNKQSEPKCEDYSFVCKCSYICDKTRDNICCLCCTNQKTCKEVCEEVRKIK